MTTYTINHYTNINYTTTHNNITLTHTKSQLTQTTTHQFTPKQFQTYLQSLQTTSTHHITYKTSKNPLKTYTHYL